MGKGVLLFCTTFVQNIVFSDQYLVSYMLVTLVTCTEMYIGHHECPLILFNFNTTWKWPSKL